MKVIDQDVQFFTDHPDRQARIRLPGKVPAINAQRAVKYVDECEGEFWSLGPHDKTRRRLIIWRVPADSPYYRVDKAWLLKIPFLAFGDETIEDRDDVLLPILHDVMLDAAVKYGGGQ